MNMSANHIELRNDTQRYENQLCRTTPKEYKVDDVKTTPKRARTSVQISTATVKLMHSGPIISGVPSDN